eukprot:COSAG01_NODE_11031_length_2023_cov_12.043139_1_plen_126_part_00
MTAGTQRVFRPRWPRYMALGCCEPWLGLPLHFFAVHVRLPPSQFPLLLSVQLYWLSPLGLYPVMHWAVHEFLVAQLPGPQDCTWATLGLPEHVIRVQLRCAKPHGDHSQTRCTDREACSSVVRLT